MSDRIEVIYIKMRAALEKAQQQKYFHPCAPYMDVLLWLAYASHTKNILIQGNNSEEDFVYATFAWYAKLSWNIATERSITITVPLCTPEFCVL